MSDGQLDPLSGHTQRTTTDPGTPAGRTAQARDSTGAFTPAIPTVPDEPAAPHWPADTRVGKYHILGPIGGGGMGFVYRALNPDLDCAVALKVIRAGELAAPDAIRRFERECQALARFRHANIVTVHDAGQYQGQPFLVMEYLGGGSLAQNLGRFQCDPRAAVALIEKIARAVQQLHADGVLHRDLKPANVLLDDAGEPRVADFGLVKLLDNTDELTGTGHYPGTAPYMAPEQTGLVATPMGPPTDVWALGVMLYELLLNGRPFAASDRTTLLQQIVLRDPELPRKLRPSFDAELEAVVLRCLHKDPSRRYATAGELADELARWLRGEPTQTRPEGRWRRLRRLIRRRPMGSLAVGLAGAALLALLVMIVIRQVQQPDAPLTFIGESGPPKEFRWIAGKDQSQLIAGAAGDPFSIRAGDVTFIELAPVPPWPDFRLEALVRHDQSERGEVGIYVGGSTFATAMGDCHVCWTAGFSEFGDHRGGAGLDVFQVSQGAARPPMNWPLTHEVFRCVVPGMPAQWRQLAVQVQGDRVQAFLDDKRIGAATRQTFPRERVFAGMGEVNGDADLHGGVGIYAVRSAVSFRHARIERLESSQ